MSYSHADEDFRIELDKHLAGLGREGVISVWHDRRIFPGDALHSMISEELQEAQIVLLLVSSDFLSSDYCVETEMSTALSRHEAGAAKVIPVILRPCDWLTSPFGGLMAVPKDGKAVTQYESQDEAFLEVAQAVRHAATSLAGSDSGLRDFNPTDGAPNTDDTFEQENTRSPILKVPRQFTDLDRSDFLIESFMYISQHFKRSLTELQNQNDHVSTRFHPVDNNSFEAEIYISGDLKSRCGIWVAIRDSYHMSGIFYSSGSRNSFNEVLSVKDDGFNLHLSASLSFNSDFGRGDELTVENAKEILWSKLMTYLR